MSRGQDWCRTLYEGRAAELMLYGRALGLSHGEAEDVLHDVFLALLRLESPPRLPAQYCVRAYRNRALNLRRGILRRLAREPASVDWFESRPDEDLRERAAIEGLTRLPPEQREVVVLKIWHGYTFEEIGGLIGISPNTAAGRYRYALDRLRGWFQGVTEPNVDGEEVGEIPEARGRSAGSGGESLLDEHPLTLWLRGADYERTRCI